MKRILVIDDEPDITLCLKKVLEENGFACVDAFNDPADVLVKYNQPGIIGYDFAIIDIVMPTINGFDLYERIKKIDRKQRFVLSLHIEYM